MRFHLLLSALCLFTSVVFAQTNQQSSGWLFLMNNTKINDKWGVYFDAQFRSQDKWDGIRNVLLRPGLTYFVNGSADVTLGYLYTNTFTRLIGAADNTLTEHRVWEQFIYRHKIGRVNFSHRLRLEQRFMERYGAGDLFAQRFRYFIRGLLPLTGAEGQSFEKGVFAALQNEIFLNVQHKSELNGHVFDQNRAYGAIGYRFGKQLDVEAGYMNQALKGLSDNTVNNIVQLAVYTRF